MELTPFIRAVPDFPKAGILFRDITPLLAAPAAFSYTIAELASKAQALGVEAIAGIESRGFIFGAPMAATLKVPFVPIRKPGKLPAAVKSQEYSLEYGTGRLDIHIDALSPFQRVVVVDDLLATGGTASAAANLVELLGAKVVGLLFVIELATLGGRAALQRHHVESLLQY
ncbi:MAG: adenine phosphoribosyltransferase [Proteobacteria bacterium]|nr:adenine phosphoribosyltransferase [Pseudomonadota bacterium]